MVWSKLGCHVLYSGTCLITLVGVNKGMLSVEYFLSIKSSFLSVKFHGDHNIVS